MSALASPEFVSLCQAQLRLLTQQMSSSSAAVYIADMAGQLADAAWVQQQRVEPNFIPVVSYPEPVDLWVENFARATAWSTGESGPLALLPAHLSDNAELSVAVEDPSDWPTSDWPSPLQPDRQLMVPLVYADVVVGLMVAIRRDRAWKNEERHYIENVGQSLAAGCVMERRTQWLQSQMTDKRDLQSRQSEIFHNLLHQFRNPLTAVTTFGQLLVRRLEPEDPNQKIATGIVRESKRLREMVAHFDETVALGDADLARDSAVPLSLPASPQRLLPGHEPTSAVATLSDEPLANVLAPNALEVVEESVQPFSVPERSVGLARPAADGSVPGLGAGLGHPLVLSAQYLPDIVEPILAVASIVAQEKGVLIQSQVAADTPSVWGEEEALVEVVSNLVDNAVKYSPVGAKVWVQTGVSHTSETDHYQGIVVGDTGPGIPASDLARLFERNYRGVQAEGDIPGTGLGLAIAQSLMVQMQGSIEVISPAVGTPWMPPSLLKEGTAKGRGTVFIVWLKEADATTSACSPMTVQR